MERFGFVSEPFTREIRTDHRYKVDFIEAEVKALREVVEARQSGVIIGPAGSGKTVVLRTLLSELPESRYRVVYLKLADLGARDMCRQIALGLGLPSAGSFPSLARALEERLQSGFSAQSMRQVLIFDDAHELRADSLRLARLLTNFDMDSKLVVSVVLAGQLPLKKMLTSPELEDVRQRMSSCSEVRLFSREESLAYITHRVKIAGASKSPFAAGASDAIFEITKGNMRAIDTLANMALRVTDEAKRNVVSASDIAIAKAKLWM